MSYQEKNFLGDLGSSSYLNYGQEVLDVLNISQLLSSNSLLNSNKIESYLRQTIAQCQKHYIGQPELATESDSKVVFLCLILEQIFSHGLRTKINFSSNSTNIQKLLEYIREFQITSKARLEFWNCVSFILPNQERERFLSLKLICTDTGRGRAWLRSTLNERSLERYLKCLQDEPEVLEQFYESKAWIRDKDKYRVLLKAAADISPIVFALGIDSPDLNTSSREQNHLLLRHCTEPEIIPSTNTTTLSPTQSNSPRGTPPNNGSVSPSKFRRSKKPSQSIISFDDTGENKGVAVTKIESIESAMKMAGKRDVFESDQLIYNDDFERKNLSELTENGPLSELRKYFDTSSSLAQDNFPFSKENSASSGTSNVSKSHNTHTNSVTQSATSNVNSGAQNCDSQFNNSQSNSRPSARDSTNFSSSNSAQSVPSNSQSAPSNFQSNSHVAPSNNSQPHLNLVSSNTYLTHSNNPSNTYLTPSNTYLTSTNPSNTYLSPSNKSSTPYLAPSNLEFSNPSSQRTPSNNSSTPYLAPSNNSPTPYLAPSNNSLTPYLAPSNNSSTPYLAPSNLEFSNPSSRSSQDSLLEADCLSSEVDLMSVSQYSEARSDLSIDHRSVTGDSTVSTMEDGESSVYSNAHSTQGRGGGAEFSSLRLMGDTGIGELTPLTSYIATSSYISSQPGLDNALDASLYADEYSVCPQGIDAATLYGDGTRCSQSQEFEEDSLSICSTSDGGVSTSVPLPGSRRSGGEGGQMGREEMAEKRNARYEAQIQELNRENELLKHQLRKYVTAVQLLNTDQQQHIVPSSTNPNINSISSGASSLEAESEARSYEKKLIQLAEMHSELLEMNQRLKIDLMARESTVTKLTSELMILRGIKPSPVSLWLPCVFLGGPPSDPHHIYQIHIRVGTEEWNVYRRYSDFYTFNKTLHRRYPKTIKQLSPQVKFPPKNLIFNKGNKSALFVEERRQKLELYLRAIVTTLVDYEFGTSSASVTSTMTPSSERKLNKYALVTLVPFLNDFYKSANVARHSPLGSATSNTPAPSSINPIKRLSTSMNIVGNCLKPNSSSPTSPEDNVSSSNNNSTGTPLQYNGL